MKRLFLALICCLLAGGVARAQDTATDAQRIATVATASHATVCVMAPGGQGGGSGVLISADGYALSNWHVTSECGIAMQCGLDDGKLYDAVLVGLDPVGDVGLIKLLGRDDFPFAPLADSDQVRVGDACYAIGNPFLLATDFTPSVSGGIVSGVRRYQYPSGTLLEYADCLQTDAAINPGNSGGPLFNARGEVIGINGRGSFEKRGRVNVGVGYAISINQIKYFLAQLKAGRLVDHATLGARVTSQELGKATVDDILEDVDAYRRGLRYGDQVIAFGGRSIASANALKNVLGIFPRGYRVPLSYRHKADMHHGLVRLEGVHTQADLTKLLEQAMAPPDAKKREHQPPKNPGDKPKEGEKKEDAPTEPLSAEKKPTIPEIVAKHFEKKTGFINFYFNKLETNRVSEAVTLKAAGDPTLPHPQWIATGELTGGGDFTLTLADDGATLETPGGKISEPLTGNLSEALGPPGSNGMLVTLGLWRRFLLGGVTAFTNLTAVGSAPCYHPIDDVTDRNPNAEAATYRLDARTPLDDVLSLPYGALEFRFIAATAERKLSSIEMFVDEISDPCEVLLGNYREFAEISPGALLPRRLEVRAGSGIYAVLNVREWHAAAMEEPQP